MGLSASENGGALHLGWPPGQFPVFSSEFARLAKGETIFTQTGNMSDETWGEINPVNLKKKKKAKDVKLRKKNILNYFKGRVELNFSLQSGGKITHPVSSAFG